MMDAAAPISSIAAGLAPKERRLLQKLRSIPLLAVDPVPEPVEQNATSASEPIASIPGLIKKAALKG